MKIFLSWSGDKSKKVATLFDEWLPLVLQVLKPWISTQNIDSGSMWHNEIQTNLNTSSFGIFCITQDNLDSPWILFEAGAISKGDPKNNVCTFLVDLVPNDILSHPLTNFNHTINTKDSIYKLLKVINSKLGDLALNETTLLKSFNKNFPDFESDLAKILEEQPAPEKTLNYQEHLLHEILTNIRSVHYSVMDTGKIVSSLKPTSALYNADIFVPSDYQLLIDDFKQRFFEINKRFPSVDEIKANDLYPF